MKVYKDEQFDKQNGCVLALGSFETLHTAHLELIYKAAELGKKYGVKTGVHLFSERIENVIFPEKKHKSIYTNAQRERIISQCGVDFVYFEKFDEHFMNMDAQDFARMLKEKFGAVCVVAGFHYSFGKGGAGDAVMLKEYGKRFGFDVEIMEAVTLDGEVVSSTGVREFIKTGDMENAKLYLGREYALSGNVKHDRGVGSEMGIPTANIDIDKNILLPKNGVYAAHVLIDEKKYPCVLNIGIRPTFGLDKISVEAHIIDYSGDLYGRSLDICVIKRLRDEKKFDSKEELVRQILDDVDSTKDIFSEK